MTLEFWRDIAIVWLALLCLIGMVIPLALAAFAVKGMHVLVARTPSLLGQARGVSARVRAATEAGSQRVVEPFIALQRTTTRAATVVRRLTGPRPPQREGKQA